MSRNLLHITKLEEFKEWLDSEGIAHRPGRGGYEVLQVNVEANIWHCVFRRLKMFEHYSTARPLDDIVSRFCRRNKK